MKEVINRRALLRSVSAFAAVSSISKTIPASATSRLPIIRLSSNENPLGMSDKAKAAATEALKKGHLYPGGAVPALARKISARENVPFDSVAIANGSTGILEAIVREQAVKGATLINPAITYGDAKYFAESANMPVVTVPMTEQFKIDLPAMEAASLSVNGPVVVYIVTPNNPTGLLSDTSTLFRWIKRAPANVFFIMDEAYHELVNDPAYESTIKLVREGYENLIVARTFSKVYAMAGMRVGYGIAAPNVIKRVKQHYSAWSISVASLMAANASLDDDAFLKRSLESNMLAKAETYAGLKKLGLNYIPSQTNFLIHQIGGELKPYQQAMRKHGFLVGRDMNLGFGWNRLSIGTPGQMKLFLQALGDIQKAGWT